MGKKSRLISLILAGAMMTSMFAGCSNNSSNEPKTSTKNETGAAATNEDPLKDNIDISVAMWDLPTNLDGKKDWFFGKTQKDLNITIKAIPVTWDDYAQKFQLWASSGEMPDVIATDAVGTNFYRNWIDQGVVRKIPKDLSAYPNLVKYMQKEDFEALREPDGNLYCVPRAKYDDLKYNAHDRIVTYRWDLAQKAGITKEPETWEEFQTMLKSIIEKDPEKKKVTGLTVTNVKQIGGLFWMFSNPAATSDGSGSDFKWIKEDGKYVPAVFSKNALPSLQNARDMYTKGLVDPDVALIKGLQGRDKFIQGKAAALLHVNFGNYNTLVKEWRKAYPDDKTDPTERFKTLRYLPSTDGQKYHAVFKTYWSESYFSSNVDDKKMDRIMRLYDYTLNEDTVLNSKFGEKDVDYKLDNGKVTLLKPIEEIATKVNGGECLGQLCTFGEGFFYTQNNLNWDPKVLKIAQDDLKYVRENVKTPEFEPRLTYVSTPTKNKFTVLDHDDMLNIMLSKEPVDKMWNKMLKTYEDKGLSKMVEEVNAKAKELGIK